jgi:hypothetical protein
MTHSEMAHARKKREKENLQNNKKEKLEQLKLSKTDLST